MGGWGEGVGGGEELSSGRNESQDLVSPVNNSGAQTEEAKRNLNMEKRKCKRSDDFMTVESQNIRTDILISQTRLREGVMTDPTPRGHRLPEPRVAITIFEAEVPPPSSTTSPVFDSNSEQNPHPAPV